MSRKKPENLSLEHNLDELKKIVEIMEQKNLSLEDSLAQFEHGIQLVRESQKILADAEQKIAILLKKDGEETLAPFEDEA
jgi:exodeoxyribonuclease VII small subunit